MLVTKGTDCAAMGAFDLRRPDGPLAASPTLRDGMTFVVWDRDKGVIAVYLRMGTLEVIAKMRVK
jgi:hypothetical protein